jgi:hypothetical protein
VISASSVSGVCVESSGMPIELIGAKGSIVGGVVTLGSSTR